MPELVNIYEAKTQLSRLVARAAAGEEIVIGKAGSPVAKLVPYVEASGPRRLGVWAGQVAIHPEFDEADPDITRLFEGT
jgi:prevent-host-death family protein